VDSWAALAAVAAWCYVVALVGTSLGLVLGTLRLPILLLVSSSPAAGAGANIGISAVSAATGSLSHMRAGRVNWRLAAWMIPPSVVGALIGGYVSGELPSNVLLVLIGVLLVCFGVITLRGRGTAPPERTGDLNIRAATVIGFVVGVIGGLVGLILGTLRVPAMIRRVGEVPHRVVATNLVVGFALGVAGVVGHLPGGVDWKLLLVGSLASIPGAVSGSRLTGRMSEQQLLSAIGVILLIVGALTLVRGVV
jgi:uncharacterized membrane protein YfcA